MGRSRLATAARIHVQNTAPGRTDFVPLRPAGAVYLGNFRAPALETVRLGIVGLGERCGVLLEQLKTIPHAEVVGLCDLSLPALQAAAQECPPELSGALHLFSGPQGYERMLEEAHPDAVLICTTWATHASMAVAAMEHGAHALVEVPLGLTLQELWQVVDTAERTQRHCMMMENCCYGRDELMFLNMVRQGFIGDLLHGEAAYIHDLRERQLNAETDWHLAHLATRNGNLYPTHGLGPLAQYMNLARTDDTFDRIVSLSSPALGRAAYAEKNLPPDHPWNQVEFKCGDINTSIIKTRLGRTILVQWDETSPRPYNRRNLIQGTEGTLAGFPTRIAGAGLNDGSEWVVGDDALEPLRERFEHPLWRRLGEAAAEADSRGGMNYILLARIVECLHRGEPLDQNVYEGALWSAVAPLSEKSVREGGLPQGFPDFTRGDWQSTPPLGIVE
ncbi:MAG: Gfo/Idh/MocA family oxidoreductase [Akkermansia sp.]|nr:Gfo/Idh/MocA family oxidoreductase [Akkermansia sp.]